MSDQRVFRGYGQSELDRQYNNRRRFPRYEELFQSWREWSAAARTRFRASLDLPYGSKPTERLDVFPADRAMAPIYVFLHGGYWQSLDKRDYSFVAEGMIPNGVTSVVPNFALAPASGMDEIVRQCRAAIAWLWQHARDMGGDPDRIYVGGHSAGGHLATMLLATDWPSFAPELPARLIKGACAISGLFDMEPIRLSYLNDTLGMSKEISERNDPLLQRYPVPASLMIVLGDEESEEYFRQVVAMADVWTRLGYPLEVRLEKRRDHFDVVHDLRLPASDLVRAQLRRFAD